MVSPALNVAELAVSEHEVAEPVMLHVSAVSAPLLRTVKA
jgi:hypothetical protein